MEAGVNAVCPESSSVPVPKTVVPSLKVTVPNGVVSPLVAVTVAVKMGGGPAPKALGFRDEVTAVVVVA